MEEFDASDEKQVADAKATAGRRQKKLDSALSELLASPDGRLWFWDLLGKCNILSTPFRPGETDTTAFGCGEQNIGLQLVAQLSRVSPEAYVLMMKEQNDGN